MTTLPIPRWHLDVSSFFYTYLDLVYAASHPNFPFYTVNGLKPGHKSFGEYFEWTAPTEILTGIELLAVRMVARIDDMIRVSGLTKGRIAICRTGIAPMGVSCLISKEPEPRRVTVGWQGLVLPPEKATAP